MKYMISWRLPSDAFEAAARNFLAGKGEVPEGLATIGRWHAPGSQYGWHLVEGDIAALSSHAVYWGQFLELEITPVVEDETEGGAMASVFGD